MNFQEAIAAWQADQPQFAARGVTLPGVRAYMPEEFKRNFDLAMDAVPAIQTDPNSAVPAFLTTMIDPKIFEVLFAPNRAAIIAGEERKGTWLDETAMFPTVEHTGEVSSYGDWSENGRAGVNTNWPQRQAYLYQTIKEYGDRELERAGLARINWVSEIDKAAATVLNKYANLTYFFGVQGLQNYGLLNDPNLGASLTPATKAAGGTKWISSAGVVVATANEVFTDIQSMFYQLVTQTGGLVEADSQLVLAMSPASEVALTATNTFNVNVFDLLKKNFPNIRFETAVQYGASSASNPQGVVGGSVVQLIADSIEGQETAYCAFNEKLREFPVKVELSSFKQKMIQGTWGCVVRMPIAIAQMQGV